MKTSVAIAVVTVLVLIIVIMGLGIALAMCKKNCKEAFNHRIAFAPSTHYCESCS